ncbi:hypothetical protein [Mycoplana rhizolycopersici]|uniref:Uncharacterized protein n=1 Tax=Mycoplana rhizolycopersici TaxID=2746702 RepID=A0ABX2QLX0_9HYPH|nr:hypothetical protein [Rhizobium rhizolycopersici]NVP57904.1 hypothetical protein [Rhizobium rhizolycopersici]
MESVLIKPKPRENGMPRKAVSQFVIVPPRRRVAEYVDAKDRFSAYLSDHFPGYEFRITGNSPFSNDDFHIVPIMGSVNNPSNPDGDFERREQPDRAVLHEMLKVCQRFDLSKSRLS